MPNSRAQTYNHYQWLSNINVNKHYLESLFKMRILEAFSLRNLGEAQKYTFLKSDYPIDFDSGHSGL